VVGGVTGRGVEYVEISWGMLYNARQGREDCEDGEYVLMEVRFG